MPDPLNTRIAEIEAFANGILSDGEFYSIWDQRYSEDIPFLLAALRTAREALREIAEYRRRVPGAHADQLATLARAALAPEQTEGAA